MKRNGENGVGNENEGAKTGTGQGHRTRAAIPTRQGRSSRRRAITERTQGDRRQAGVARDVYSYFETKAGVFRGNPRYYREIADAVLSDGALEIYSMPVRTKGDLKKLVRELIRALYTAHTLSPALHREITAMIYGDPEVERLIREEEGKTIALVGALLSKVSDRLAVADVEAAVEVVVHSAEEVIHRLRMFEHDIADERVLGELEDMMYRYLFVKG